MGFGKTNVAAGGGDEEKLKAHLNDKDNPHEVTAEQVGAAKADHTHTAAQVGARPNTWTPKLADVAFLGNQPISAVANDTTANWVTLGSGYAWYYTGGLLNNQPSSFGFLVSYVNGSDVFQIWRSQNAGPTYMRSGNASGWASAWVQVSMDGHTHDGRYYTETEMDTKLAGKADSGHAHKGVNINPSSIEVDPGASAGHGGYIDFHYNGSAADYTSRIIESASGKINISAKNGVEVSNPSVGSSRVRNIQASTTDLTAGSSALTTGNIYLVYE